LPENSGIGFLIPEALLSTAFQPKRVEIRLTIGHACPI
jgi:hypothetical protein